MFFSKLDRASIVVSTEKDMAAAEESSVLNQMNQDDVKGSSINEEQLTKPRNELTFRIDQRPPFHIAAFYAFQVNWVWNQTCFVLS